MSQAHEAVNLMAEMDIFRSTIEDVKREKSRLESSLHFIDAELGTWKSKGWEGSINNKPVTMKVTISEQGEVKNSKVA